jgi:hypothetical protein
MFYKQLFFIFIVTMLTTLASCSVTKRSDQGISVNNQPGATIQTYLAASNASSETELSTALTTMKMSKADKVFISERKNNIFNLYHTDTLLLVMQNQYRDSKLAENLADNNETPSAISILVRLFPIDAYRILTYVTKYNLVNEETLLAIAVENNLDPTIILEASAAGIENSVTPLIHSAGIVIYGQDEDNSSDVRYREVGDTKWLPALELAWEPIYGALSGSIVHLIADTDYEVEVKITDYDGYEQEYSFSFKTRPNFPPIDPNKIYYLSEIYSGGQLDLEALNIYGSKDGYAKIIGDGQAINVGDEYLSAVNIGSQAYIMLENLTIKGGERYGVFAKNTHDIWIKGCDISEYGRVATIFKNGKGYASENSTSPINYDSGIYLEKTGVSVIEECEIHSPNGKANHWGNGHPNGPNALQVWAYHPQEQYRGQMIVRNNRFYGTQDQRFNDVIEGRKNFERTGGFVRDSAIYGNYLAYANDDLIEIDGGQRNVLVYENELTQGYAGISIAPNMLGPSYLFHNNIHDLGDERGKEWTAIKAGGLLSKPGGQTFILENYIDVERNGLASSGVNGDGTYWVKTQNNVILSSEYNNLVGLGIYDKYKYYDSSFTNDFIYNKKIQSPFVEISYENYLPHPSTEDSGYASHIQISMPHKLLVESGFLIPNISRVSEETQTGKHWLLEPANYEFTPFHDQTKYGAVAIYEQNGVSLEGNIWNKIEANLTITTDTVLELDLQVEGLPEIVGLAFENDNKVTKSKIIQFYGSQNYGVNAKSFFDQNDTKIDFPIGKYLPGTYKYIVFVLDNDINQSRNNSTASMKNIVLKEVAEEIKGDTNTIVVGMDME